MRKCVHVPPAGSPQEKARPASRSPRGRSQAGGELVKLVPPSFLDRIICQEALSWHWLLLPGKKSLCLMRWQVSAWKAPMIQVDFSPPSLGATSCSTTGLRESQLPPSQSLEECPESSHPCHCMKSPPPFSELWRSRQQTPHLESPPLSPPSLFQDEEIGAPLLTGLPCGPGASREQNVISLPVFLGTLQLAKNDVVSELCSGC